MAEQRLECTGSHHNAFKSDAGVHAKSVEQIHEILGRHVAGGSRRIGAATS
jgi:hypothetical protein